MLVTTFFSVAQPVQKSTNATLPKTMTGSLTMDDVPIWDVNDTWTYKVNDITLDFSNENRTMKLFFSITELPLRVTDTSGDFYTVSFTTTMSGDGQFISDLGEGPVDLSIVFKDIALTGSLRFEKTTLGIVDASVSFEKQKVSLNIKEQPYLPLPAFLRVLSVKITSNLNLDSDSPLTMLTFPLTTGIFWNLSSANISTTGKIESKFFNLLHLVNIIASMLGIELLPPTFASLLPIISIQDAMTEFLGTNVVSVPMISDAFFCFNTENVTVPAGIFEAFNITLFGGMGQCFFAPDAGNMILLSGNFEQLHPAIKNIDMELISTTYT